jgi:hypothetical protein
MSFFASASSVAVGATSASLTVAIAFGIALAGYLAEPITWSKLECKMLQWLMLENDQESNSSGRI